VVNLAATGLKSQTNAIREALIAAKRMPPGGAIQRRNEPSSHDVQILMNLFQHVGAPHLTQIQTALSYPTDAFRFLPTIRNFFAHRNADTAGKVRNAALRLGIAGQRKPSDMVCSRRTNRPQSILADWLDDMRAVISLLCE
jgi:hypothetical protein